MANEEQTSIPNPEYWMEENPIKIDFISSEDWTGDDEFPYPVPTNWIDNFQFIDPNQIILMDNDHFINTQKTKEKHIYRVNGEPYIKIDNYVYPIIMLDKNNNVLNLNDFQDMEPLKEAVKTVIILMIESEGYLNYSGQLVKEKK